MSETASNNGTGNGTNSVGRYVSILHRYWQIYLDRALAQFGIGAGQLPILIYLFQNEGVSQSMIVEHLRTDKSSIARTIRKLVDQGYIERLQSPDDGRAYHIQITGKARAIHHELRNILSNWTDVVSQDLSENERTQLFDILGRMLTRAEELVHPYETTGDSSEKLD